jgi:hypothetical protein
VLVDVRRRSCPENSSVLSTAPTPIEIAPTVVGIAPTLVRTAPRVSTHGRARQLRDGPEGRLRGVESEPEILV